MWQQTVKNSRLVLGPRKLFRCIRKTNEKCSAEEKVDWCRPRIFPISLCLSLALTKKLGHVSIERAKQKQWKVHNERRAENAENGGRCQSEAIEKQLPSVLQIVNFVVRFLHSSIAVSNAKKVVNRKPGKSVVENKLWTFVKSLINVGYWFVFVE